MAFTNIELRYRIAEAKWGKQRFAFGVAPFIDAGTVCDRWQDLNFTNIKFSLWRRGKDSLEPIHRAIF